MVGLPPCSVRLSLQPRLPRPVRGRPYIPPRSVRRSLRPRIPRPARFFASGLSSRSHVRPNFSYKDAILSPFGTLPPHRAPPTVRLFNFSPHLPLHPPRFLLNLSLKGCCYQCFERGHFAFRCREPRRCLLCMSSGHWAFHCKLRQASCPQTCPRASPSASARALSTAVPRHSMDPGRNSPIHDSSLSAARLPTAVPTRHLALQTGPSSNRTSAAPAFIPPRPPPAGNLTSRVVWRVSISLPGFRLTLTSTRPWPVA